MKKSDVINIIFNESTCFSSAVDKVSAFAPTNIALCKYWGKRDEEINLPLTSSLSVAIPGKGAHTTLQFRDHQDLILLNGKELAKDSLFVKRLEAFLDLFRPKKAWFLEVKIEVNIPIAAGLASSACGFASLVLALNSLFNWQLSHPQLSILARLGSGSAARSLWNGFVAWEKGNTSHGMDSYAEPLPYVWPELCLGILYITDQEKAISSRQAMKRTLETSVLYQNWPQKVAEDLTLIITAITQKDFSLLGSRAESNALNMHATMLSAWPPICYSLPETLRAMHEVWDLRKQGFEIYFTQDAGPNLKLLFLKKDATLIKQAFKNIEIEKLF